MLVKQAANVINLLEFFSDRKEAATLAEIADGLGWPRSSTFNMVGTLVDKGYLYEPCQRGNFYPSPRWLTVAQEISSSDPLPDILRQLVDAIGIETGETTAIGAISGLSAIFLYVRESREPIRYNAEIGTTVPLHASSAGRAILTQMSAEERASYCRKITFEKYAKTTPMSIQRIEDDLREAHARGYHQSDSEYIADLAGVALPLPYGERRLSLVVAGPVSRCLNRRAETAQIIKKAMQKYGITQGE